MKYSVPPIIANMLLVVMALTIAALPATAKSAQEIRDQKLREIPTCEKSYGAISVIEPEEGHNWWTGAKLPAPSTLIKVYVRQSRCFDLVDRGAGFQAGQAERELAAGGNLRKQSNVGRGQIRAADYVMVPELAAQNSNAGGGRIGGLLGGVIGGRVGAIVGGLDMKKATADVALSVSDVRSSEIVGVTEGHGKRPISVSGLLAGFSEEVVWVRWALAGTPTPR